MTPGDPVKKRAPLLALLLAPPLLAGAAEIFGRPLRGLTPVPIASVTAHPEKHRARALRVTGEAVESAAGRVVLSDGGARLAVESDGSFAIPADLKGARVTAEGRLKPDSDALAASGLEVRR